MYYVRPENIKFEFIKAGTSISSSDDGLIDYTFAPSSEGPVLTDEVTVNGNRGIIDKLDKGGNLTLSVMKDTPLHASLDIASKVRGQTTGFLTDDNSSGETINYSMISGSIQKATRQLSVNATDFIFIGNFDVTALKK